MNPTPEQKEKIQIINNVTKDLIEGIDLLRNVLIEEITNLPIVTSPPSEKSPQKCRILSSVHSGVYPQQIGIIIDQDYSGYVVEVEQEYVNLAGGATKTRRTKLFFNLHEIEIIK